MRRAGALALTLCAAMGCSAIINPETTDVRCEVIAGVDPCPTGQRCVDVEGVTLCRTTVSAPDAGCIAIDGGMELCNGLDDNCDGRIDEGQDRDQDSFTWCGGGVIARADCDDGSSDTFPNASEVCDGRDNNCNTEVDEGVICPPGQQCVKSVSRCIAPSCTLSEPEFACPAPRVCNRSTGQCEDSTDCRNNPSVCMAGQTCQASDGTCITPPAPLGGPCNLDEDCESGRCFDFPAVFKGETSARRGVCGRACCTDSECPTGTLCWAPGTGTRTCIPAERVMRAGPGTVAAGAGCTADAECRSGECFDGTCVGTCTNNSQCTSANVCGIVGPFSSSGRPDYQTLACDASSGLGRYMASCQDDTDCELPSCMDLILVRYCSAACRTSADCSGLLDSIYCAPVTIENRATMARDVVSVCRPRPFGARGGRTGASCTRSSDCFDNLCVGGKCADTCCNDSQCAAPAQCRPTPLGSAWVMRCVTPS